MRLRSGPQSSRHFQPHKSCLMNTRGRAPSQDGSRALMEMPRGLSLGAWGSKRGGCLGFLCLLLPCCRGRGGMRSPVVRATHVPRYAGDRLVTCHFGKSAGPQGGAKPRRTQGLGPRLHSHLHTHPRMKRLTNKNENPEIRMVLAVRRLLHSAGYGNGDRSKRRQKPVPAPWRERFSSEIARCLLDPKLLSP